MSVEFERMVNRFLHDHPEHIAGTKRHATRGLVLDKQAALALMEWCLLHGMYSDRAKLEASIREFRAKLTQRVARDNDTTPAGDPPA